MLLVLAYGNPLRGDDAVGWWIAEGLRDHPDTEVVCVHQLVPELAARIGGAGGVLFVDAAVGAAAGEVTVRTLVADPQGSAFGHVLPPSNLLYLARTLAGWAPEARLLTVSGREFGFSTSLSAGVFEALPGAVRKARAILETLARAASVVGSGAGRR